MSIKKLTEEQKRQICELCKTNSVKKVAEMVGATFPQVRSYIYRADVRQKGYTPPKPKYLDALSEEQKAMVKKLYPDHSQSEISRIMNVKKGLVNRYVSEQGLTHTQETIDRFKRKAIDSMVSARTKETYAKISVARKRRFVCERFRIMQGSRQETKLRVSTLPFKTRRRMTMLCYVFNYFRSEDLNDAVVYYDSETRRSEKAEKYAMEKYHIRFEKADDE